MPISPARALVDKLRYETVQLFHTFGAASNQIGRTYQFREARSPAPEEPPTPIIAKLYPKGLINPASSASPPKGTST